MTAGTQPVEEVRLAIKKGGWIALVYLIFYSGNIFRGIFPQIPLFWISAFNVCYLAGCVAALAGLLIYPRPLRHSFTQLRLFGDVLIATAAVLTLCWLVMIQPIMNTASALQTGPFDTFISPLGDLLLLIAVLDFYMLAQEVWGHYRAEDTTMVRRYIWLLRQKVEDDPANPRLILTLRGFGYRQGTEPLGKEES